MKYLCCIVFSLCISMVAAADASFPFDIRIGLARIVVVGEVIQIEELMEDRNRYHIRVDEVLKYQSIHKTPPERLNFVLPSSSAENPIGPTGQFSAGDKKVFLMNLSLGDRDYVLFKEVFSLDKKGDIQEIIKNPKRAPFHGLTYWILSEATVRILPGQMEGGRTPRWEELLTDALSTTSSGLAEVVLRKVQLSIPEGVKIDWSDVEVGERISLYDLLEHLAGSNGLVLEIQESKVSLVKPPNREGQENE